MLKGSYMYDKGLNICWICSAKKNKEGLKGVEHKTYEMLVLIWEKKYYIIFVLSPSEDLMILSLHGDFDS